MTPASSTSTNGRDSRTLNVSIFRLRTKGVVDGRTGWGHLKSLKWHFDRDGFAISHARASDSLLEKIQTLCIAASDDAAAARRGESVYGIRHLLALSPELRELVSRFPFIKLAAGILGPTARPVKGVFFDKTSDANWPISWHQDVTIQVRERREVPGFESRNAKDGAIHVLPPVTLSEQMLALRIHLDDAPANHGALRVIPGSHRCGRLTSEQIRMQVSTIDAITCNVCKGDVMIMSPLLVHASSACELPTHRRVVHIEYAPCDLPGGLEWHG